MEAIDERTPTDGVKFSTIVIGDCFVMRASTLPYMKYRDQDSGFIKGVSRYGLTNHPDQDDLVYPVNAHWVYTD